MSAQVDAVIKRSSADFLRLVWPQIGEPYGSVIPVETVTTSPFANELDRRAGIDVWLVGKDGHMRGLASRVQWQHKCWESFTVRVRSRFGGPTEYHKRKAEMTVADSGVIRCHYFVQGYVRCVNPARALREGAKQHRTCTDADHPILMGAAIALVDDVIAGVDAGRGRLIKNPDGSQGYAVWWSSMSAAGAWVESWPKPQAPTLFDVREAT